MITTAAAQNVDAHAQLVNSAPRINGTCTQVVHSNMHSGRFRSKNTVIAREKYFFAEAKKILHFGSVGYIFLPTLGRVIMKNFDCQLFSNTST